jgi:MerR family transcriptional regulator, light-induced transcriptional regulator
MQDGQGRNSGLQFQRVAGGVASFASDVVSRLIKGEFSMTAALREDLIVRFLRAVVSADLTDFEALKPELRRARISPAMFSDRYLPEIARRMGKAWEDDSMSFAEVTMGSSRLQAILRQISAGWSADEGTAGEAGLSTVLLIVPGGQQHTLGAFVLLGQLRRKGISVCLRVGPTDGDLRALLAVRQFDGAMVSLALPEDLAATCAMIGLLKEMTLGLLPIALGGAALLNAPAAFTATEADIVTNDLKLAIGALGLSHRPQALMVEINE